MIMLRSGSIRQVSTMLLEIGSIAVGFRGQGHVCDYTDSRRGDDSSIIGITQLREVAHCKGSRLMGPTEPYRVYGRMGL